MNIVNLHLNLAGTNIDTAWEMTALIQLIKLCDEEYKIHMMKINKMCFVEFSDIVGNRKLFDTLSSERVLYRVNSVPEKYKGLPGISKEMFVLAFFNLIRKNVVIIKEEFVYLNPKLFVYCEHPELIYQE